MILQSAAASDKNLNQICKILIMLVHSNFTMFQKYSTSLSVLKTTRKLRILTRESNSMSKKFKLWIAIAADRCWCHRRCLRNSEISYGSCSLNTKTIYELLGPHKLRAIGIFELHTKRRNLFSSPVHTQATRQDLHSYINEAKMKEQKI